LNGTIPTPYGLLFTKIGGSQPTPKTSIAIVPGTSKATDFKFGRNIRSVHPNKSLLKFWRKGRVGVSRDCRFFGTGKATYFKFCSHIYWLNRNKSPLQISGKVAVGVVRDSRKFSGHPYIYRAHRAVIFAIAQLSCLTTER